jgi:hypothetical protein
MRFRYEVRIPYRFVVGDVSGSGPNARKLVKSDLYRGPHILRRHRCGDTRHNDDRKWNEQLRVERWFRWRQFKWGQFRRRSRLDADDPHFPMLRWHAYGCGRHIMQLRSQA